MRTVVVQRPGGHDRLRLEERPTPEPGPGEVRVASRAAGVNFADVFVRLGLYGSARRYVGWPITPGFEYAGAIDAVGPGVEDLAAGDEVFGVTRFGGYASHVVVSRHQVRARPTSLGVEEAAGFPTVALTAWYALHELVRLRPGSGAHLLVHSAAGGVGGMLVQLGRLAGCRVTAVVGARHKVETARELGADDVIDRSSEELWPAAERLAPEGFDVVLDANGPATLRESYRHLAPEGRLVVYGFHTLLARGSGRGRRSWWRLARGVLRTPRFNPLALTQENRSVMGFNLSYLFDRRAMLERGMDELLNHVASGDLCPSKVTTFPLEDVAAAHRALESGETVGKVVLTIGGRDTGRVGL